jgi:hypothetical protein
MGPHSSHIKDILFVSTTDFDPPELHRPRKYRPEKEVKIDYSTYKARKYYKEDATDAELS